MHWRRRASVLMRQFGILRNPNPDTSTWAPYLLVLQCDLLFTGI